MKMPNHIIRMVLSGVCVIAVLACNAQTRKDTGPILQTSATSADISYKPKQASNAATTVNPAKKENKTAITKSNSKKAAKAQKKDKAATAKADKNDKRVKTTACSGTIFNHNDKI